MDRRTILLVDDDDAVLRSLTKLLEDSYKVVACGSARQAMECCHPDKVTAVLSDIRMPGMSGLELSELIHKKMPAIPVILMTAYNEVDDVVRAVRHKAFDFLIKPFKPEELFDSVERAVTTRMDADIETELRSGMDEKAASEEEQQDRHNELTLDLVHRLTIMAESRDSEAGSHIARMGQYAHNLASELGLSDEQIETIAIASQMHDIGNIGIPDNILLKPAALTKAEFGIMQNHTEIGERILTGSLHRIINMAAIISAAHHEKWDGSGYPRGLKGVDIPIECRIIMLCDQYDALRSRRPHKGQLSHDEVMYILNRGDGRSLPQHFDPAVLAAFNRIHYMFDLTFSCK